MICSYNDVDPQVIESIKNSYRDGICTVDELASKYNLERNAILSILNPDIQVQDLPSSRIDQEKFLIISDTHIDSILEKIYYLDYVYNFAIKYGIKSIVHAGDLTQGTLRPLKSEYEDQEKLINHLLKKYPYDKSIKNEILLGNHDLTLFSLKDEYMEMLKSRDDFNILGYKMAYIEWLNNLITVNHETDKYRFVLPNVEPFLRIVGHRHVSSFVEPHNLYVPSLSLDTKKSYKKKGNKSKAVFPGFMLVEHQDDLAIIYNFLFKEHIYNTRDAKEIRKKVQEKTEAENLGIVVSLKLRDNYKK